MTANTTCRAFLLAEIVALVDGVVLHEGGGRSCADPVAYAVFLRRDGVEVGADVCISHEHVISHLDTGFVRSIKKRVRTT